MVETVEWYGLALGGVPHRGLCFQPFAFAEIDSGIAQAQRSKDLAIHETSVAPVPSATRKNIVQ